MILNTEEKDFLFKILGTSEDKATFLFNRDILEFTNESGDSVEYFIGDFRKKEDIQFYIEEFNRYKKSYSIELKSLLIFNTWEAEQDFYEKVYKKYNALQKREIKKLFESSQMIYLSSEKKIKMELEENGINYLEYGYENTEGFIFNVPLSELSKLYNITGKNLFKDNVRIGIRNVKATKLRAGFKEIFEIGLYNLYKERESGLLKYIETYFNNKLLIDFDQKPKILENFWFHHNGITIFSEEKYTIVDENISFKTENVSVINGAQTLTHCFSLMREIKKEWLNMFKEAAKEAVSGELNRIEEIEEELMEMLTKVKGSIKLKVIFLYSDNANVKRSITHGLNTQIPIIEEDILGNSKVVEELNAVLKIKDIRISKSGEFIDHEKSFGVLEFIKVFLTFIEKPGEARNLKKEGLEEKLKEIKVHFTNDGESLVNFKNAVALFYKIDEWWNKKKKPKLTPVQTLSYEGLSRNGKYYFKSYCYRNIVEIDTEFNVEGALQEKFDEFISEFSELSKDKQIDSNELKKNELYDLYANSIVTSISSTQTAINENGLDVEQYNEFIINENYENNKSHKNLLVKRYFKKKGLVINFRTITVKDGKLKEDFPFKSETFRSLYEEEDYPTIYGKSEKKFPFRDSEFRKALLDPFLLVIFEETIAGKIISIKFINDFNFSKYLIEAEKVYDETVKAFKIGDANKFPKISDKLFFHIRPKAQDSKDTFEFTNGEQEVKRTFWANKETMQVLIKEIFPDKELVKEQEQEQEKQLAMELDKELAPV